jgi:hypothetical protein
MKKLMLLFFLVAAVSLTSCNGLIRKFAEVGTQTLAVELEPTVEKLGGEPVEPVEPVEELKEKDMAMLIEKAKTKRKIEKTPNGAWETNY